jgi:ribA/ribD-fused uncharacterized protein
MRKFEKKISNVEVISDFHKEGYEFLSNFYLCEINLFGITYPSAEHAYQAYKYEDLDEKRFVANLATPGKAKRYRGKLCDNWEMIKVGAMKIVVEEKFIQNGYLWSKLMATDDAILIEGNMWHDNFWGKCNCSKCVGIIGINYLGNILMQVREELK